MYEQVLGWLAAPLVRVLLVVLVVLTPILTYFWGKSAGWDNGFAAGKLDQASEYGRLFDLKTEEIDLLNKDLAAKTQELEQEKLKVKIKEVQHTHEVERIVNENPDFSSVVRPPELDALRLRELREIDEALRSAAR